MFTLRRHKLLVQRIKPIHPRSLKPLGWSPISHYALIRCTNKPSAPAEPSVLAHMAQKAACRLFSPVSERVRPPGGFAPLPLFTFDDTLTAPHKPSVLRRAAHEDTDGRHDHFNLRHGFRLPAGLLGVPRLRAELRVQSASCVSAYPHRSPEVAALPRHAPLGVGINDLALAGQGIT